MNQKREFDFTIPLLAFILLIAILASSCSRSITVGQAAAGKAKCGMSLR